MNQTPASNETKLGILTHEELNQKEAIGLMRCWEYLINNVSEKFDSIFINQAHKAGFSFLYDWAGKYRVSTPIVGELEPPAPHLITELMHKLFADLDYKLEHLNADSLEEVVGLITWFEYKFIAIHPYTNTNGRMGRLLSNFILFKIGYPILNYTNRSAARDEYISAMRNADKKDLTALELIIGQELKEAITKN